MAGSKRLRSTSKATSAAAESDSDPSLTLQLFEQLKEIAGSPERSIAVLQDFCDSKCSLEPPKRNAQTPSMDCNAILVATHILKRLLHSSPTSCSLISSLGDLLSRVLVSDSSKLEKASHVGSSRPILAYALLTATIASLHCLEQYEGGKKISATVVETSISTLHRLVYLNPHGEEVEDLDWNLDKRDAAIELSSAEEACVSFLLHHNTESGKEEKKPSPAKRKSRRKSSSSSSDSGMDGWFETLEELKASDPMYSQLLDARVAVKRWASVALVWEYQGQLLLLQVSHKLAKQAQFASCSSRSKWMNSLVQIVAESGLHCGLRPPTGHMDHLIKIIRTTSKTSSSKSASSKRNKSKPQRADIRDWTAVAIYDLLDVHRECLKNITAESTTFTSAVIVNDGVPPGSVFYVLEKEYSEFTAPDLSSNLVNLCSAASSCVSTTDQGMRASWAKSLVDLFTACALRLAVDPELPLDCSLIDVAVSQLANLLENTIDSELSPMDEDMDVEELHGLLQALPEPNIKKIDTSYTSSGRSCTYAGLDESIPLDKPSHDASVAIVMRAIWTAAQNSGNQEATPAAQLVATLSSIVERVYDTREPTEGDGKDLVDFIVEKASKSKKRSARGSGRASKRRKTKQEATKPMEGAWRRINEQRAEVATEALKALKFCLWNQSIPTSHLRQSIRKSLGPQQYTKLVELGTVLDRILVRAQKPVKMDADGTFTFSKAEQALWAAHMEMCQYLGRGKSYDNGFLMHPILGTNSQRKSLYQSIAKNQGDDGGSGWSLSLPAAHQTLLIANLTSERKAITRSFTLPELYIVKEYVKSIHRTMQRIQTLKKRDLDDDHIYVETDLQLSYNDARVFVLAFCRLMKDDQLAVLRDLVTQLQKDIKSILSNPSRRSVLGANNEASGFVARVLVVCGCLLDVVTVGSRLEKLIFTNNGGQAKASFPSFVSTLEWYTSDRCFMSIFDWESPMLPDSSLPQRALSGLDSLVVDDLQMALEQAFEIGFESARQDKCHLLFAAWNMMDKINAITDYSVKRQGPPSTAFPKLQASLEGGLATRFLEIREDMTKLHSESNEEDGYRFNATRLRTSLRTMLTRANALVEMILANHVAEDEIMTQSAPLLVFGLLEALSIYISAAIARHTKPGNDYFSVIPDKAGSLRARSRGDSSESEQVASDADSIDSEGDRYNDARSESLDQLRRCCYTFGAAPIHPDWLDVSCSLRNGIRYEDAIGAALDALRGLKRLALTAFLQYRKHSSAAMKEHFGTTVSDDEDRVSLCIRLCNWANGESSNAISIMDETHRDDVDWKDTLATLFGVPHEVTEVLLGNLSVKNLEEARAAWCPNCTQHDEEKLQDRWLNEDGTWDAPIAELRACGEWDLLLAQSLTSSSLDVQYGSPYHATSATAHFAGHPGHEDMVTAQLWRNVMATAISGLMPAAALLRVGLGRTGRKPHPFCFQTKRNTDEEMTHVELAEELPRTVTASSNQKAAVFDTVSLLSYLAVQVDQHLATECRAVACHLLTESKSFDDLRAVQTMVSAFSDLKATQALHGAVGNEERSKNTVLVTEMLSFAILESSKISEGLEGPILQNNCRLMTLFGASQKGFRVDTIVQKKMEPLSAFVQSKQLGPVDDMHTPKADLRSTVVEILVRLLCKDKCPASDTARASVATLLSTAVSRDFSPSRNLTPLKIVPTVISSFNTISKQKLTSLILKDLCCLSKHRMIDRELSSLSFRKSIANILCFLLLSSDREIGFKNSKLVFEKLGGAIEIWSSFGYEERAPLVEVQLLYACRFNGLKDTVSKLVSHAMKRIDESTDLSVCSSEAKALSNLFAYVSRLRKSLSHEKEEIVSKQSSQCLSQTSLQEIPEIGRNINLPLACSYVQESGFRTQHWYNCYTCGLVWDKGCCTLCALTCHKGHDVAYSRCSSFFCDCGAESNSSGEQSRVSCQCLSSFTRDQTRQYVKDDWLCYETVDKMPPKLEEGRSLKAHHHASSQTLGIVKAAFRHKGLASLKTLTSAASNTSWHNDLFRILQRQFQNWHQTWSFESKLNVFEQEPTGNSEARPIIRSSHAALSGRLRLRRSRHLSLHQLSSLALVPVRATVGFQAKLASDSSASSHLRAKLQSGEISRSILVADSRGRLILAEPCTLVFLSSIPTVNVRHVTRPLDEPMTRQQMCILGLGLLKFNVIGMQLCADNERHLVVWGLAEACVVILKSDWTGIEDTINLVFDIGQGDSDDGNHLVKCEWIPGSESNVVVGCSRFVRIYDVTRTKNGSRALPVIGYNLGFDANLRDVTMVSSHQSVEIPSISKMFLLLENGRLHMVDLKSSEDGRLESPADQQRFEPSECVSISMCGVRSRSGIGAPGSATRTLGEGSRLAYLKQSRTLLYKCSTSCVIALMLDKKGAVEGTFEFLPHMISAEASGNATPISGPYTHWTELGLAYRNGMTFFRVSCVGRSVNSKNPKLLCIEFNENESRVRVLHWAPGDDDEDDLMSSASFAGLAAFSTPFISTVPDIGSVYGERAYLGVLASNGNMFYFGEECIDSLRISEEVRPESTVHMVRGYGSDFEAEAKRKPSFPLTIFETLKNIGDSAIVVFGGRGIGSDGDDLKNKFSRDSGQSFVCPNRSGCTITVSLRAKETSAIPSRNVLPSDKHSSAAGPLVIAAIRILVGSSFGGIPSRVVIQGRPLDLTPRVKKWYCVPLTKDEIALGVRSGFISVGIERPFDSSSSIVIDAIEVYGIGRESLEQWLPKSYIYNPSTASNAPRALQEQTIDGLQNNESTSLVHSCQALSNLCEVSGGRKDILVDEQSFLRQLVEETALDSCNLVRDSVQTLLKNLEPDARSRTSLLDECILSGCSRTVSMSRSALESFAMESDDDCHAEKNYQQKAIGSLIRDSLQVASRIANERPMNYLKTMDNAIERDLSSASLAVEASKVIISDFAEVEEFQDMINGPEGIIELSLIELALNTDSDHSEQFAAFSTIRKFLDLGNPDFVKRTCDAISNFCGKHAKAERKSSDRHGLFTLIQNARLVCYQCDSCAVLVKKIRYTLLEGDHDIDLCQNCYSLGKQYAESHDFRAGVEVKIKGKSVGADQSKLDCEQLKQMQPVSLKKMDVELVEPSSQKEASCADSRMEEDKAPEDDAQQPGKTTEGDRVMGSQAFEDFLGFLFKSIVHHVSNKVKKREYGSEIAPMFGLLLELVQLSQEGEVQNNRAKHFANELCLDLSYLLRRYSESESSQVSKLPSILCLRALSSLLAPENYVGEALDGSHSDDIRDTSARQFQPKEKTDPNYVCPVHKIPAVRRRCASGTNKDRRFYVCGMERGQRCKYFVWADEAIGKPEDKKRDRSPIYNIVQGHLWSESAEVGLSLQERLCQVLENLLFDGEDNEPASSALVSKKKDRFRLASTYSQERKQKDFADGVYCSREKLQDTTSGKADLDNEQNSFNSYLISAKDGRDHTIQLLESSLDLLVLVADHKTQGISRWFSLLCEIIVSKTKHAALRPMAKKVLKNLCGGKMTRFQTIRDHFGFWFQLKRLYRSSITYLEAALIVKEKSRCCHPKWSTLEKKTWANLCVGDLIGADELISEDTYSHVSCKKVGRVLDDLWNGIKSRDDSWRKFCRLRSLPQSLRDQHKSKTAPRTNNDQHLSEAAPIMALFWISCALSGTNQTKAIRILDFALNSANDGSRKSGKSKEDGIDEDNNMEEEESTISFTKEGRAPQPEEILMSGKEKLTVDGFVAFCMTYVNRGRTAQLRQAAAGILKKLTKSLSTEEQGELFQRLVYVPMEEIGRMGKASNEFLGFLQSLSNSIGSSVARDAADLVLDCFDQQIEAARYDRSNGEWVVLESNASGTSVKKRFDISPCLHCQRQHSPAKDSFAFLGTERPEPGSTSGRNRGGFTAALRRAASPSQPSTSSRTQDQRKWHKDQIAAFTRGRIDSSKESSGSNEFCSFFVLKYRLSVSEIHLSVNDPRGRYVKTINVYFSPRQVKSVSELKAEGHNHMWQKCATLSLSRGALRASATLSEPIIASNLKVEYAEFYERPGGSKAADGSFVVHCPRCTRVVTNAHGVCGNCGEVAFQCRKCRHINYDRLDAFLCVECGYCASGSFSYELTAGVASNAVTITSDQDRDRAIKMLGNAISIENDIRSAILEKVSIIGRKKANAKIESSGQGFNSSMKMAFMGIPSSTSQDYRHNKVLDRLDKPGSVVKYVARPNSISSHPSSMSRSSSSTSTVDRTRSLLRLARQIRNESGYPTSGSSSELRRSGDVIIRQLGRGLAIDHMEDDNDLLGLLEGEGLDAGADPLSRALAASSRRRGLGGSLSQPDGDGETTTRNSEGTAGAAASTTNTGASAKKTKESNKEAATEFLKLHSLMREAEREKNELTRRLQAWDGLCRGALGHVDTVPHTSEIHFAPSHCSTCSVPVAQQLLTLWLRLFQARPSSVTVDLDFICTLLEDMPGIGKGFLESKRLVVREIATKSPNFARLVLGELRTRLSVSKDMNCAEILGKILEVEDDFPLAEEFSQLAMDVLAR